MEPEEIGATHRPRRLLLPAAAAILLLAAGCAHGRADRELDEKARKEPVRTIEGLGQEAREMIQQSPRFTPEQRARLLELQARAEEEGLRLRDESMRLRSLLLKDMMQEVYDPQEVARLKKRIQRVEQQRVALLLNSIDQADRILGRGVRPTPAGRGFEFHDLRPEAESPEAVEPPR